MSLSAALAGFVFVRRPAGRLSARPLQCQRSRQFGHTERPQILLPAAAGAPTRKRRPPPVEAREWRLMAH